MLIKCQAIIFFLLFTLSAFADSKGQDFQHCFERKGAKISFVEFPSFDLQQQAPIAMKGVLKIPGKCKYGKYPLPKRRQFAAVLILHGSAGVDSRGDYYARALNDAGIATLEIDYWEARGVDGIANRPQLPILTYPDTFAGLAYLSNLPNIDPARIGVIGFSWGGVMSLAAAESAYAAQFGNGLKFAAHVSHYPVCYGANNDAILAAFGVDSAAAGTRFRSLTGAPVLIQTGDRDDYDNGAEPCQAIPDQLFDPREKSLIKVRVYPDSTHAWDRLQVPVTANDPFADQGSFLLGQRPTPPEVEITPNVRQAKKARRRVVKFFLQNL